MNKLFFFISLFAILSFPQELHKVADGINFPEGPAWDGKGNLFVSSNFGGYILKITGEEKSVFVDSASTIMKQTNGLTFGKDGWLYGCDFGAGAIIRISPDKDIEVVSSGYQGKSYDTPNDLAFYKNGDLYFSEPNSDQPDGRLFRLNMETREPKMLLDSLRYPNGLVFSEDWRTLFLSESASNRVLKLNLDDDGNLLSHEVFINLPGGEPDGLALDVQGNLYVAHFEGGMVYVVNPDAEIIEKIKTPGIECSNVEFGGDDMKTLFITEDETGAVYSIRRKTAGLKLLR
jgi:gluconolactonase